MALVPSGKAPARSAGSAPGIRRLGRWFALGAAVLLTAAAVSTPGIAAAAPANKSGQPDFGPNVKIFDPSMTVEQIQATVDAVRNEQIDNEMGTQRYTLLFKPGTYGTA